MSVCNSRNQAWLNSIRRTGKICLTPIISQLYLCCYDNRVWKIWACHEIGWCTGKPSVNLFYCNSYLPKGICLNRPDLRVLFPFILLALITLLEHSDIWIFYIVPWMYLCTFLSISSLWIFWIIGSFAWVFYPTSKWC